MLVFLPELFQASFCLIEGQRQKQRLTKLESSAILISGCKRDTARNHSGQYPVQYLENIGPVIELSDWLILVIGPRTALVV